MSRTKLIFILFALLISLTVPIGYATWTYSADATATNDIGAVIHTFSFTPTWANKDCLDKNTIIYAEKLATALNNTKSSFYKLAFRYNWYVGNMDDSYYIRSIFKQIFGTTDSACMIFKNSDGTYYLYITYKNLNSYHYGVAVKPVYRITYQKVNNIWYPVKAEKGQCNITTYDLFGGEHQKALAMTTFN